MTGRLPLPLSSEQAAARRRGIDELRASVRRGEYRVPAEQVAEAMLEHVRRWRHAGAGPDDDASPASE